MSRLTKIVLVMVFMTIIVVAAVFAIDSWYKDFGPNQARLQGRWVCNSTVRWEGVSMVIENCMVRANGSTTVYHIDWNANGDIAVVTNSAVNEIGSGKYEFVPPWSIDSHGATIKIQMDSPTLLANGITLGNGEYIVEMKNINELEIIFIKDGVPQGNRIRLTRQFNKFDLSVIASYLFGF